MGFRELQKEVDTALSQLPLDDPFRRTYLKILFEINGNLDSMSLSLRALVEIQDKGRLENAERWEAAKTMMDDLKKNLGTPVNLPAFPTKAPANGKAKKRSK